MVRPFLTAEWRHLLFINVPVPPEALGPYLPRGVDLDPWDGRCWMSLVGFRFLRTRLLGVPVPFHTAFDEFNLRFYVRRTAGAEVRRAVVFVRELVPRRAIAWVAQAAYNEPYRAVPMRSTVAPPSYAYAWRLGGRWHTVGADTVAPFAPLGTGTFEEFITEHYFGYTPQRDGGTVEYRVEHPRWRVAPAAVVTLDADFAALYGAPLAAALAGPSTAFVAEGSPVAVHRPVRVAR